MWCWSTALYVVFFFNDTATTEIYTLSPTRRSSDLAAPARPPRPQGAESDRRGPWRRTARSPRTTRRRRPRRSEEHTSELQSRRDLVCRLLLEKKKKNKQKPSYAAVSTLL